MAKERERESADEKCHCQGNWPPLLTALCLDNGSRSEYYYFYYYYYQFFTITTLHQLRPFVLLCTLVFLCPCLSLGVWLPCVCPIVD